MAPMYAGSLSTAWRTAGLAVIARRVEGAAESSCVSKKDFVRTLVALFYFFNAFSDIYLFCSVRFSMHGLRRLLALGKEKVA
jgi:hypothetical protein